MTRETIDYLKLLFERVNGAFDRGAPALIPASERNKQAFIDLTAWIETEYKRRHNSGLRGGRPVKPDSELSQDPYAIRRRYEMRRYRERKRGQQKQ